MGRFFTYGWSGRGRLIWQGKECYAVTDQNLPLVGPFKSAQECFRALRIKYRRLIVDNPF